MLESTGFMFLAAVNGLLKYTPDSERHSGRIIDIYWR